MLIPCEQWRIQAGGALAACQLTFSLFDVSYELVNLSFIISGHRKWPHLAIINQYCENGLQMENKSREIHHLGTQKDAKLCLKCTKIHLAAGLHSDPLESFSAPPDPLAAIQGFILLRGGK